jgi:hypothetical protein
MRQFSSLAAHLLARYRVPAFFDSVWFVRDAEPAKVQQDWYRAIGNGVSPREIEFPLRMTRRMAHFFLRAPGEYSIDAALRYGQVVGMGGSPRLVAAVLGSRLGASFANDDFWSTVIRWLIVQRELAFDRIGPLIDFIHRRRFGVESGGDECLYPADPEFTVCGRNFAALLREMHAWHAGLRDGTAISQAEWSPCGIVPLDWTECTDAAGAQERWTTVELLSHKALFSEGRAMRHCVASYAADCVKGGTSIWSLGMERDGGRRRQRLTIEVAVRSGVIQQIRGKANRLPTAKEMGIIGRWAVAADLTIASHL